MLVDAKNVENYVPQRSPILLVDNLLEIDGSKAYTSYQIKDSVFVSNSDFEYHGVIEHLAQSSALFYGYLHGNKIGMIGSISRLKKEQFVLKIHDVIESEINLMMEFNDLISVKAKSFFDGIEIMSCDMTLHFDSSK